MISVLDKKRYAAKCRHPGCTGTIIDSQDEAVCLACGRPAKENQPAMENTLVVEYPPKPAGKNKAAIGQYYEDNRERIIADWRQRGTLKVALDLDTSSAQLLKLLDKWDVQKIKHHNVPVPADSPALPPVPPKPRTHVAITDYYKTNMYAIKQDMELLGRDAALARWQMHSSTFYKLSRYGAPPAAPIPVVVHPAAPPPAQQVLPPVPAGPPASVKPQLPPFPDFVDTWPEAVQLAWIDTYLKLKIEAGLTARSEDHGKCE